MYQEKTTLMGREVKRQGNRYIVKLSNGKTVSGSKRKIESAIANDKNDK